MHDGQRGPRTLLWVNPSLGNVTASVDLLSSSEVIDSRDCLSSSERVSTLHAGFVAELLPFDILGTFHLLATS